MGIAASLLAAAAMAVDHLLEDEGAFPADVGTFLIACGLSFALALAVFGWLLGTAAYVFVALDKLA